MKVLDLFSGIGGFSLGLERAGMETVAFVEIDKFCQKVLRKHWPNVPIYDDVRNFHHDGTVDLICGGFPCQDLSIAGKQQGLSAERSGLWFEMLRIIGNLRPRYVIVENVAALRTGERGDWFRQLLSSLAKIGYDAEWETICASQVGAPHHRERIWVIAYPRKGRRRYGILDNLKYEIPAHKEWDVQKNFQQGGGWERWLVEVCETGNGVISKNDFCVVDDGLSKELVAIAALGNAVVPQIPEIIGRAIMEIENNTPC